MEKFKVAFIFCHPGCKPEQDRSIVDAEDIILYSIGCSNYGEAEKVAKEMVEIGCVAIDLCGAFGNEGVARISHAIERKVPVGAVNFDFHPVLRDKSGDDLFQKDFWCVGIDE